MKVRNMEEKHKSVIRKKKKKKGQREDDMEKIIWASRQKPTANKINISKEKNIKWCQNSNKTKQCNSVATFSKKFKKV